jgi:hypothetical protein
MFNLTVDYHWYFTPDKKSEIIKVYKINGISYSYDKIPRIGQDDPELISTANKNKGLNDENLFYGSYYLIEEMMHPLLFNLDIDYPELLPSD